MKHALVIGKFMPPHAGHVLLLDFARHFAERLTILVCSRPADPIPGPARYAWVKEMFPYCRVEHFTESATPAVVDEAFWQGWRENIRRVHPEAVDYLITPEAYGRILSDQLGAALVPAPPRLTAGTDIRNDPMRFWADIPDRVRPYFVQRVCVHLRDAQRGARLGAQLAACFGTPWVARYEAPGLERAELLRGQLAANAAAAFRAQRALFVAADAVTSGAPDPLAAGAPPCALYLVDEPQLLARIEQAGLCAHLLEGEAGAGLEPALRAIGAHLPALHRYAVPAAAHA